MKEKEKKLTEYKEKFLEYYRNTEDREIKEMLRFIEKTGRLEMMNGNLLHDYDNYIANVSYDDKSEMPYVISGGVKVFFPKKYEKQEVSWRYIALIKEQDVFSPHKYMDDASFEILREAKESGKRLVVIELGAMEGMFSLSLANIADEMYLFECDPDWVTALKETFRPWKNKTTIVEKMVDSYTDQQHIALDEYGFQISEDSFLVVKMDIEGSEREALAGMKKILDAAGDFLLFVCTYHRQDDEALVRKKFHDCHIWNNRGYFCFYVADDYAQPYVRRCVLRIKKGKTK